MDKSTATRVDGTELNTPTEMLLPRSALIIKAFRSGVPAAVSNHPLLTVAAKLAAHHQQQWIVEEISLDTEAGDHFLTAAKRSIDSIGLQRLRLIEGINAWAARRVPSRPGTSLHTETLGSIFDRLAIAWVRSNRMIDIATPDDRKLAQLALQQLAGLADAYDDLVRDVVGGRRRLPNWREVQSHAHSL